MAQVVSRWLFTVETWVRSKLDILWKKWFSQTTSVFPYYYNSTFVPYPFTSAVHAAFTRRENGGGVEPFQKPVLPPKFGSTRQNIIFAFRASKNNFFVTVYSLPISRICTHSKYTLIFASPSLPDAMVVQL